MNKGISKWPARALNLLVVLAMVISLSAILVAPPIAQAATCIPTPVYTGCHLSVAVSTYIKDEDGKFIPKTSFNPPPAGQETGGDCFYVNAVVVNDGNETASAPINATIDFPNGGIDISPDESYFKQSMTDLMGTPSTANPHRIADFWWKVCCEAANGNTTIRVNVTADSHCDQIWPAVGETTVFQGAEEEDKCLEIQIVEAPGLGTVQGHLATYESSMPSTIQPCQNFGIKAEIYNNCDGPIDVGDVYIGSGNDIVKDIPLNTNLFALVGGDLDHWTVESLAPGKTAVVAWTLHCEGPGDGNVTVWSELELERTTFINDPVLVHQATPGMLRVEIMQPTCTPNDCNPTCEIKQPNGCDNTFLVQAKVTNTGDITVMRIEVLAAASRVDWVSFEENDIDVPDDLGPGESAIVDFGYATCLDTGLGNITVSASGRLGSLTGPHIYSQSDYSDTLWWRTIDQKLVIAQKTPGITPPAQVNKCDSPGFDVSFRYNNYTDYGWSDPATGNITATIYWTGDVELAGTVWYRRVTGGLAESWQVLDASPTDLGNYSIEHVLTNKTPAIPAICPCCAVDVKWHFKCTDVGNVTFYSTINVQQTGEHPFTGNDTSENVCVEQVYKAHLTGDVFFFVQDQDTGVMTEQTAVVPGSDFHVVIPVINTGDATARNAQVYFTITDQRPQPTQDCPINFEVVSFSGDGTVSYNPQTGVAIASLGDIPGHSAKKVIVLVHCLCEGGVAVWIQNDVGPWDNKQGIRANDANTGTWVPQANILIPPCPEIVQQIPYRIVLENPYTCQTFTEGDLFAVKALITNGSKDPLKGNLEDVSAMLSVTNAAGASIMGTTVRLVDSQNNPKDVGNISYNSSTEITWELECYGGGEAFIQVSTSLTDPKITVYSDIVNVHQIEVLEPDLNVLILSPVAIHTMIATGEQFAVSAMVANFGDGAAEDVQVAIGDYDEGVEWYRTNATIDLNDWCITPGSETVWVLEKGEQEPVEQVRGVDYIIDSYALGMGHFINIPGEDAVVSADWLDQFSLVDSEMVQDIGDLGPGETKIVTWTMRAETTCDGGCMVDDEPIFVSAWNSIDGDDTRVFVDIYPAAHLVTVIGTVSPVINVCDEFNVSYKVYNIGQADAWNTSVTLSVEPAGSVRIAGGETGYTQMLGTIVGWDSGPLEQRGYAEGTFKLHCKMACESTITITPYGYDECGIHMVQAEINDIGISANGGPDGGPEFIGYAEEPGRAIEQKFLEPASKTVKQLENGLDMAITKTADKSMAPSGTTVKFTVTVTNNGPIAASGIVVSDTWTTGAFTAPAVISKSQGSLSAFTSTGFTWNVGSLPVGGTASLVYTGNSNTSNKIVNTATVTSAEADGILDNNTASVELNVVSMQFTLKPGWNLFSLPLVPGNSSTVNVVGGITQVAYVYGYDAETGTWLWWSPPNTGTLTNMTDGWGYWIYLTGSINKNITITGTELPPVIAGSQPPVPPSYDVFVGWNLLGFKSTTAKVENVYLAGIAGEYTKIYGYADGAYFNVVGGANLQPGSGYWIAVPGAVPGTKVGSIFP